VGDRDNLHGSAGFAKHHDVGETAQQDPPGLVAKVGKRDGCTARGRSLPGVRQETLRPRAHCEQDTKPPLRQPRPKPRDGSERVATLRTKLSPEQALSVFRRNQFDRAGIDLLKAPVDLLAPRLFSVLVYLGIQTLKERVDQGCPLFLRQRERFLQKIGSFPRQASIIWRQRRFQRRPVKDRSAPGAHPTPAVRAGASIRSCFDIVPLVPGPGRSPLIPSNGRNGALP
jgi:hypothetical protein